MAGGIIGVEPLETPGAYRAQLANGTSMLVHGAPGEDLYERYKPKPAALGPDATADASSLMSTPDENMSRADVPMGGPAPSKAGPTMLAGGGVSIPLSQARAMSRGERVLEPSPSGQGAQPVPQPEPEQPRQTGPVSMGYAMKGLDPVTGKEVQGNAIRMPDGSIGIMLPGSRGTPGGLTTLGKEKLEHTREAEFQAANQNRIAAEAHQEGVDLAKREADERAGYLEEQKQRAIDAMKQQQEEQAATERRVSEIQAKYDKAREDFMDSKVDPDEYMKRRGGAVGMFSALGVAMAQFGGAFTGQPNVAMQFVNNQIDRSIRAQEAQINIKGRAADNMLADLTREMGSLSSAKLAMRQLLTERSAIEMQQIGAGTKSAQIQALATETSARAAAQAALLDNARKQAAVKETFTDPLYYRQGRAGSPNRIALPTQESAGKMQESGLKVKEFELAKQKAEAERVQSVNARTAVQTERTEKIASFATAAKAADEIMNQLEARNVADDAKDDPTAGLIDRAGNMQSNELINQNTVDLAKGMQSAFGKSDRDAADAQALAEGGGSGRDRYQAAERAQKKMVSNIRAELATLPPSQAQQLLSTMPAEIKKKVLGQQ